MPRFYCGPLYWGPWAYPEYDGDINTPEHNYIYLNWQIDLTADPSSGWGFWTNYPNVDDGKPVALDFSDLENSYIDAVEDDWGFGDPGPPEWFTGSHIWDNMGYTWTVVLPSDLDTRRLYLYPNTSPLSSKIYYSKEDALFWTPGFEWYPELAGAGSMPFTVDPSVPDVIWNAGWFSKGANAAGSGYVGYSIVTECGEDAHGTWIKIRPVLASDPYSDGHDWDQVRVCGAQWMSVGYLSGGGENRTIVVMPHPAGTSWMYDTQGAPSFEESRDRLEGRGYITLYIDELTEAMEIFETINEAVGSYLYCGYDGKYRYKVFEIEPGESVMQFADDEIFSFEESVDATEVFSNVRAEYAYRRLQDFPQVYLYEKKEGQYLQGSPIPVSMERRLPFSQRPDAIFWAQRALQMYGERRILYKARVSAKGWTLLPGEFAQFTYSRRKINAVLEILEVKRDLNRLTVDLVLGDQHGMMGGGGGGVPGGGTTVDPGFWMDDAPTLPSRFSGLAGYGTGDAGNWNKDWAAEIKAWARQNMGFWCDENGYADPTDPDSRLPSTWV